MPYTDRYIKAPCIVVSADECEMVGESKAKRVIVRGRINPMDIAHYREEINGEGDIEGATVVELKSGSTIAVEMSLHDFEKLLNKHQS